MVPQVSALERAYMMGHRAALDGESKDACPYDEKRNDAGRLTWTRAFRRAWFDGWEKGNNEKTAEVQST